MTLGLARISNYSHLHRPDIIITNMLKSHQKLEIRNEGPLEIRNTSVRYVDMAGELLPDITRDGSGS